MTLRQGQAKEARLNGARLPSAESLRRELLDARVHARPARGRQGRAGGAPRVLRPRARRAAAGARRDAAGLPRGARAAQRRAAPRAARALRHATRSSRGRRRSPSSARTSSQRAARRSRCSARASRRRPTSSGSRTRASSTTREPPTAEALDGPARPRHRPRHDRARPAPRRRARRGGDRDLRHFGSQGEQRLAVLSLLLAEAELLEPPPLLLLDDVLSELDPRRRGAARGAPGRAGADGDHRDARSRAAGRAEPGRGGGTWPCQMSCRV